MSSIDDSRRAYNAVIIRRAGIVGALAGIALFIGCGIAQGAAGLAGAGLGLAVVTVFFGADIALMRATRGTEPVVLLAYVMMLYVFKLTILTLMLALLRDATWLSPRSFAVTVVVETSIALGMAVYAFATMRTAYVEPHE